MALRREDLGTYGSPARPHIWPDEAAGGGTVVAFPTGWVRARARRRQMVARRRRAALALAGLVVVIATLMGEGGGGSAVASKDAAPRSVVLQPGATVWELAEKWAPPSVDPRAYVDAVMALNRLDGPPAVGQRIRLPR